MWSAVLELGMDVLCPTDQVSHPFLTRGVYSMLWRCKYISRLLQRPVPASRSGSACKSAGLSLQAFSLAHVVWVPRPHMSSTCVQGVWRMTVMEVDNWQGIEFNDYSESTQCATKHRQSNHQLWAVGWTCFEPICYKKSSSAASIEVQP